MPFCRVLRNCISQKRVQIREIEFHVNLSRKFQLLVAIYMHVLTFE